MDSAPQRAAEARALTIFLAVTARAGWQLERAGLVLPAPYDGFFYVAAADLLAVPTSLALYRARQTAEGGVRRARADALIVSCADQTPGFAVGMWTSQATHLHLPARPWLRKVARPNLGWHCLVAPAVMERTMRAIIFATALTLGTGTSFADSGPAAEPLKGSPEEVVCRKEEVTGSLARFVKTCRTRAAWDAQASRESKTATDLNDRGLVNSCADFQHCNRDPSPIGS